MNIPVHWQRKNLAGYAMDGLRNSEVMVRIILNKRFFASRSNEFFRSLRLNEIDSQPISS
jgi:hypothetical protein